VACSEGNDPIALAHEENTARDKKRTDLPFLDDRERTVNMFSGGGVKVNNLLPNGACSPRTQ
jgi:hypothetical protein